MANKYYSGQGRMYVGDRNPTTGMPEFLTELGNVPNLEVSVEITKFEHKESQSGSRAVDLTIVQEKKGTFTMTLESLTIENLALAFWGQSAAVAAAATQTTTLTMTATKRSAAGEEKRIPVGKSLNKLSNIIVKDDATKLITYEFGPTATDATSKNGWYDAANGMLIIWDTTEETSRGAANAIGDTEVLEITYDIAAQTNMDAFTETSQQKFLRFEGLNTVDGKEVIVDIYKADLDPLTGYGLINEEIGSFEVTGSILLDDLQQTGSQFFRQTNVD